MKKSLLAVAVLGAFAGAAQADDALTVYGVVDAAIRSNNNATYNAATGTSGGFVGFSQGLFNGTRFGLKGSEDLGNGMKAIYTLEAGVILGTGVSDQQGQLMGRQSWAGISDDTYGSLTAGRQYGNLSGAIGTGDVFGELHGNEVYASGTNQGDVASENGFAYGLTGYRWDNSLLYSNKVGSVKFSVMHAFAGQGTASTTSGQATTMNSFAVGYVSDSFNATVGYQKETNAGPNAVVAASSTNPTHTDIGVGANYLYGDKTEFGGRNGVYAYYLSSKYDAGFYRISATNSQFNFTQTAAGALFSARQDKVISLSTNYYATSRLNLIAAYFRDTATNVLDPVNQAAQVTATNGATDGSRNGFIVTGDYYFTKNTDTYLMAAHTTFKGALIGNANGGNATTGASVGVGPTSVTTMMVGFRHRF